LIIKNSFESHSMLEAIRIIFGMKSIKYRPASMKGWKTDTRGVRSSVSG
jgi:hypothetical protein